jgi:hypothetical protein
MADKAGERRAHSTPQQAEKNDSDSSSWQKRQESVGTTDA